MRRSKSSLCFADFGSTADIIRTIPQDLFAELVSNSFLPFNHGSFYSDFAPLRALRFFNSFPSISDVEFHERKTVLLQRMVGWSYAVSSHGTGIYFKT